MSRRSDLPPGFQQLDYHRLACDFVLPGNPDKFQLEAQHDESLRVTFSVTKRKASEGFSYAYPVENIELPPEIAQTFGQWLKGE